MTFIRFVKVTRPISVQYSRRMSYDLEHPDQRPTDGQPTARVMPDGVYCCRCTRPLAGIPLNEHCPTCGTPVAESLLDNPVDATVLNPERGDDDEPLACVSCGYDLRGSDENSNCPECGVPVSRSIHGNYLVYASGSWLAQLDFGSKLIMVGLFASYATGMLAYGLEWIGRTRIASSFFFDTTIEIIRLFMLFSILLHAYGWWIFSSRDPGEVNPRWRASARLILRTALLISLPILLGQLVLTALIAFNSDHGSRGMFEQLTSLHLLVHLVAYSASCSWTASLCARLPDPESESLARSLRWAGPIIMIVLSCFMVLGVMLAGIMMIKLLLRFRSRLMLIRAQQPERVLDAAFSAHLSGR